MKDDKETEAERDDKEGVPGEKAEEIAADAAKHGYVGGEPRMTSYEKDELRPAEQDDNAGDVTESNVVVGIISGGEKDEDEGEQEKGDLADVLDAEDVAAEGDAHLEELAKAEGQQAGECYPADGVERCSRAL